MSKNRNFEPVEDAAVAQEPAVVEPVVHGVVVDCIKLNVRRNPKPDAEILCTINRGTKVALNEKRSRGEFYRVSLETGVEGYCMKKYISVQK